MGMQFEFYCRGCGYTAGVSGGRDCGFHYVSQTIVCRDCKELYDAVANEKAADVLVDGKIRGKLTGICCPKDPHAQVRDLPAAVEVPQVWGAAGERRGGVVLRLAAAIRPNQV